MNNDSLVQYLGPSDLHDGTVVRAVRNAEAATVVVQGSSGREYTIEFDGVASFDANSERGMIIYALSEMRTLPPLRRFVFVNWDDCDTASLEVTARGVEIR